MAGFAVRHPNGQIVHPYQWKASGEYQDQSSTGGYYAVCIDNQFSRFADKLVNLYLTVVRYDQWDKYTKEIEEINMNMENFTVSILLFFFHPKFRSYLKILKDCSQVETKRVLIFYFYFQSAIITTERNINEMLQFQHHSRGRETRDYNLLVDNNTYVVRWSLAQIFVIVFTTCTQVYFVRKLFDTSVGGRGRSRI